MKLYKLRKVYTIDDLPELEKKLEEKMIEYDARHGIDQEFDTEICELMDDIRYLKYERKTYGEVSSEIEADINAEFTADLEKEFDTI